MPPEDTIDVTLGLTLLEASNLLRAIKEDRYFSEESRKYIAEKINEKTRQFKINNQKKKILSRFSCLSASVLSSTVTNPGLEAELDKLIELAIAQN